MTSTSLFDRATLLPYLAAAVTLVLIPGPAQALVLARSVERGRAAGIITALGLDAATMVHSAAAALGLSAILAASAAAFTVVKLVGALYLVWLGLRMLRAPATPAATRVPAPSSGGGGAAALVAHGFVTGLLNPKVALFFLAFLPQFVRPERGWVAGQFLLLGAIFAGLDLVWAAVLATAAARARGWLGASARVTRWRERVTGTVLIALGLRLAWARR